MSPAEMIVAQKEANGISQFIDTGQTAMGGVPTSAVGIPMLANCLSRIWKSKLPAYELVGKQESIAIHAMVMGTLTAGGKHGVGGFMVGNAALMGNGLGKLYKDQLPSEELVAFKKAKIIDSHVKSCIFRGSGVGPDYTPDISGLT